MKLYDCVSRVGVVVVTAAFVSGLLCAPTASAEPSVGVAGLAAEIEYLQDLRDAGIKTSRLGSKVEVVQMGYLLCLIDQMNGATPNGFGTVMKVARRNLCGAMPPLPASQRQTVAVPDISRQLTDQFARTLVDDQDGLGNDNDLDGTNNAADRAPTNDHYR